VTRDTETLASTAELATPGGPLASTPMSIHEGSIEANGLRFAYQSDGDEGAPLALCAHGFPDSPHTWRHLLPVLANAGYRAVAPFMRGYAPTDVAPDGLYQSGAVASDLNALHEALGGDSDAVLVGHDWGAVATYSAIGHQPDRWRRAVTASVPPPAIVAKAFLSYEQLQRSWYMFFFQSPLADIVVPLNDLSFIDHLWADWSPRYDAIDDLPLVKACLRDPAHLAAALGYYRAAIGSGARTDELNAIEAAGAGPLTVPTLYLHGADDGCMGADLATEEVLAALVAPESRLEVVPGAGHFLQLEQPEQVNNLILDFFAA